MVSSIESPCTKIATILFPDIFGIEIKSIGSAIVSLPRPAETLENSGTSINFIGFTFFKSKILSLITSGVLSIAIAIVISFFSCEFKLNPETNLSIKSFLGVLLPVL